MIHDAREREMSRPPLSFPKSAASQKALLLLVVVVVFARSIIDGRHYYCKDEKNELEKNEGKNVSGQKFSQQQRPNNNKR